MRPLLLLALLPVAASFSPLLLPRPAAALQARVGALSAPKPGRLFGGNRRPELAVFSSADASAASEPPASSSDDGNLRKWDPQVWIAPAVHNKNSVRAAVIALAVAVAVKSTSSALSPRLALFGHLLSFSTWLGSVLYTTFVLGIVAFKNLPRQTFGRLQSKLFPIYFQLSSVMLILQLATSVSLKMGRNSEVALGVALVSTLFNQFYLEPQSTDIMFKRYKLEDAGQRDSDEWRGLGKQFGKFHGLSSLMNLVAIAGGFAQAWYLAVFLK